MPQVSNFSWMNMFFFSGLVFFLMLIMNFFIYFGSAKLNSLNLKSFKFFFMV